MSFLMASAMMIYAILPKRSPAKSVDPVGDRTEKSLLILKVNVIELSYK
ncbi:hypothetical protein [Anabaena sp. FACHB-83]|nr:hypothetical protein [Anabaena sp. FACHB-83]MBD2478079.1 hypothetical protein [Anabaena sp. FACHB-83]